MKKLCLLLFLGFALSISMYASTTGGTSATAVQHLASVTPGSSFCCGGDPGGGGTWPFAPVTSACCGGDPGGGPWPFAPVTSACCGGDPGGGTLPFAPVSAIRAEAFTTAAIAASCCGGDPGGGGTWPFAPAPNPLATLRR